VQTAPADNNVPVTFAASSGERPTDAAAEVATGVSTSAGESAVVQSDTKSVCNLPVTSASRAVPEPGDMVTVTVAGIALSAAVAVRVEAPIAYEAVTSMTGEAAGSNSRVTRAPPADKRSATTAAMAAMVEAAPPPAAVRNQPSETDIAVSTTEPSRPLPTGR